MFLHIQVFALTERLAVVSLPTFYRSLAAGLRWTYFLLPAPFSSLSPALRSDPAALLPPLPAASNGTASAAAAMCLK